MDRQLQAPYQRGKAVFDQEADAVRAIGDRLGSSFDASIEAILACRGRIVLTGMGKHGLVARKIAATFASTGTPAFFMHPAEGLHGDLGMVNTEDIVIAVSNSGRTQEVLGCLPFLKHNRNFIIAMTGTGDSELASQADVVLDIQVDREVCPMNLAPTTSTTAALVMGDALAVVLLERRGFQPDDFALRHPSGALGRLLRRVSDIMKGQQNPVVSETVPFGDAVAVITAAKQGAVSIVDDGGELVGILTDGDFRRTIERFADDQNSTVRDLFAQPVSKFMTRSPASVTPDTLAAKAINIMEDGAKKILVLPVVDQQRRPVGMIHLHDVIS
ncbi:MAG: KpsF/GutQ family sugar-phosphate isomerase [Candidatus Sumerlaeaceae bacterium]